MNATILNADRATHMRIVTLALITAIAVTGFAVSTRFSSIGGTHANATVYRAFKAHSPNQPTVFR